jgi:hemolysin III
VIQSSATPPGKPRAFALNEPFCAISHYVGALFSIAALILLLDAAHGRPLREAASVLFGGSLFVLYLASALSHTWDARPEVQGWLSRFDYMAIFLLIAGTYAPLCLITLHGPVGETLLSIEYGLAAIGILNVLFARRTPHAFRVVVYVLMGWLIVTAWGAVEHALSPVAREWMVAGGLCYTIGVVVFALERPNLWPGRFSAHDLWHVFVLGGSACHFWLILRYVIAP